MKFLRRFVLAVVCLGLAPAAFAESAPNPPVITEPTVDGQTDHPADVHMESTFSDPDGDSQKAADWIIVKVSTGQAVWQALNVTDAILKHHIHLGDGTFVGAYAGRTTLEYSENYVLRVRDQDTANLWSDYSERTFVTSANVPPVPGAPSWTVDQPGFVVETVATGFQLPVSIAFPPEGMYPGHRPQDPLFYVGELYGNIKVVTRDGGVSDYATGLLNFSPNGIFPGSGEQGIGCIAVEPVTGDLFASTVYEATGTGEHFNQVIRLHSVASGLQQDGISTVIQLTGDPTGASHQISNVTFHDGHLYVHVGDGFDETKGQDLNSFRGKILRMNLDGSAPSDNPFFSRPGTRATKYVFAYGFRNPFGGAWRASDNTHYEVENGPQVDRFARVLRGVNYRYDGTNESMHFGALWNWEPPAAPVNLAFIEALRFGGSNFPSLKFNHAFVTESGETHAQGTADSSQGKRIREFAIDAQGRLVGDPSSLIHYTGGGYSTAAALASGPDGLYFSDLYPENDFDPTARSANVLRIRSTSVNSFQLYRGIYRGLIQSNPVQPSNGGFLTLNLTPGGSFTATVQFGGKSYRLVGAFDSAGHFSGTLLRAGLSSLAVSLDIDITGGTDSLSGTFFDGSITSTASGALSFFNPTTNIAPQAGRYTFLIPPSDPGNAVPQGTGYGTVTISPSGGVSLVGRLGDDTPLLRAGRLAKDGTFPLYAQPYAGTGAVSGLVSFENLSGQSDFDGALDWFRPANNASGFYPVGFSTQVSVIGSRYRRPAAGVRVLDFAATQSNGVLSFSDGNLSSTPPDRTITLTATNAVIPDPGPRVSLTINLTNGLFSGVFTDPFTGGLRGYHGAVFQDRDDGAGVFRGNGQTGTVELRAAP